jgi:hypothetical protein
VKTFSVLLVSIYTLPRRMARQCVGYVARHKRDSMSLIGLMRMLAFLCAAAMLIAACQKRETPQWAPNVERTDITPSEWMVGCFAIDPMTDRLRASGAREYELTTQRASVIKGRQWYRIELNGSHLKYGVWSPVAASRIRIQAGSNGFGNLTYALSRSGNGLVGTYHEESDVSPGSSPEVPVSLRRVDCVSATAK